ncbi:hypothetical protein BHYA_0414g00030 [Botrytis hyacinthi]|uniref:Uncharacterized protein n=1 Tax=Botrytis hyacinthi TaxID=278943 RepID=A0A4Z1GCK3_9HELO|nr:hypothetical protein BHYA_0414g00030 [Botrytis hyacinthi]
MVQLMNLDIASPQEVVDMFNAMCWAIDQKVPGIFGELGSISFANLASFVSLYGQDLLRRNTPTEYQFRIITSRSHEAGDDAQRVRAAEEALEGLRKIFKIRIYDYVNGQYVSYWSVFTNNPVATTNNINDLVIDLNKATAREITRAFLEMDLICFAFKDRIAMPDDVVYLCMDKTFSVMVRYFTVENIKQLLEQKIGVRFGMGLS